MKRIFILFLSSVTFSQCTLDNGNPPPIEYTDYDLLYSYEDVNMRYVKLHVIDFFKQIALGAEYGHTVKFTKKWNTPMRLYLAGEKNLALENELEQVIHSINALMEADFYVERVMDSLDSNFYVYLGGKQGFIDRFPNNSSLVEDNQGLVTVHLNEKHEIIQGEVFVDLYRTSLAEQQHLLWEEITQGLGLLNDIPYYPQSIFYQNHSVITEYMQNDKEVIRLLYHPKMVSGLDEEAADLVARTIFGL